MRVGFIGLGLMGQAMALRLVRTNYEVLVWNRSPERSEPLREAGARVADAVSEVFESTDVALLMLADAQAIDAVLDRGGPEFARRVKSTVIVAMGTTSPDSSQRLALDIAKVRGRYVEAPVSGSKPMAEQGGLIGMLAGEPDVCALVRPILLSMCSEVVDCGRVSRALHTKLAVNVFLVNMVCGLAEAWAYAEVAGVDVSVLRQVLDRGPMSSTVSRAKSALLFEHRFPAQAAVRDVLYNAKLIRDAAQTMHASTPLMDASALLLQRASDLGLGESDMAAVVRSFAHQES